MFTLAKLSIIVSLFFLGVSALPKATGMSEEPRTNAARMALGLPPMRPRFLNKIPGRAPTPVRARDASPSGVVYTGCIQVTKKSDGSLSGYVDKKFTSGGSGRERLGVTDKSKDCLKIDLTKPRTGVFELFHTNGETSTYPLLGFASSSNSLSTLSSSVTTYTILTLTKHTAANAVPSDVGNAWDNNAASESTIWAFDAGSSILSSRWINPGGGSADIKQYFHPSSDALVQTANPSNFVASFSGSYEVVYTLI